MRRAYLDHASTSPLRPAAFEAMLPFLRDHHADPGRLHAEGRVTRVALEDAREQVATLLVARPREVVFTSSGTEAVNTAVWGAVERADAPAQIVTTAVEHSAVLDACRRSGAEVAVVGVDHLGRYDPSAVVDAVRPETALVTVQLANHEVGTIQPARAVVAACKERGVLVHVDACMAAGHVPFDFGALDADLCSVSAHKFGGPKGAGALLVRRGLRLPPFVVGGAQERARRGGLEDVPAMVGFGAAAAEVSADGRLAAEAGAQRELTDRVAHAAPARVGGVTLYGDAADRVPHLVCLGVEGVEAEPILLGL
ncbi:MAG TPA: cysteine desulfurase family protein, partial [Acidimicrobiia bacterium]|nr:cysteine desulfurase family protein [Acidimicrobiia bacterium]